MKTFYSFAADMNENAAKNAAVDISSEAQAVASTLQQSISHMLPNFYKVNVKYSENLGKSISILVYDARKESISVTYHNSENIAGFLMYLSDNFGRDTSLSKVSWDKTTSRFPDGVKYRKISAPTIEAAGKKIAAWFKKNAQAFADAPMKR